MCDVEEARPRYQKIASTGTREGEMFEDIDEASTFWRAIRDARV